MSSLADQLYSTGCIVLADTEIKNRADLRDVTKHSLITMSWKNAEAQTTVISGLLNQKGDSPK